MGRLSVRSVVRPVACLSPFARRELVPVVSPALAVEVRKRVAAGCKRFWPRPGRLISPKSVCWASAVTPFGFPHVRAAYRSMGARDCATRSCFVAKDRSCFKVSRQALCSHFLSPLSEGPRRVSAGLGSFRVSVSRIRHVGSPWSRLLRVSGCCGECVAKSALIPALDQGRSSVISFMALHRGLVSPASGATALRCAFHDESLATARSLGFVRLSVRSVVRPVACLSPFARRELVPVVSPALPKKRMSGGCKRFRSRPGRLILPKS